MNVDALVLNASCEYEIRNVHRLDGQPVADGALPARRELLRELHAECVVQVEHRRAQPGRIEQARLRGRVARHRAVVVEVVVRQVGEQRAIEGDAVDAPLVKAV